MKNRILLLLLFLCGGIAASAQPAGNPLVFGENRLTLISPTLFRLEFARDGKFIDDPTIFAYDRSNLLPADRFEVRALGGDRYEITTEALRIVYEHDGFPFGLHNFAAYYKLNGKEKKFTNRCIFRNNLGGPVETLDRVTGEIPMQDGLLSRDGWYVIDDERSDLLVDGWLCPRDTRSHVQDQYCFVYGNDYKAALADLGAISGRVPMTRKYIHGVWYCRYWDYTSEEFLSIIDGYEQNDFPLDNLVFDMGWHTYTAEIGTGHAGSRSWTGYTWERKRIPDPEALIAEVHRRGVTVSLNDHPHDGIRPHEEMYGAFMKDMGADPAKPLLFDLGDRRYMETFFKHAHHTTEDMGVDFWWLDWQQNYLYPEVRGYRSTSLQWINELYYRETERKGLRGAGYSRWAGWGDHPNPELTVRWTQFGALSAALRVHSTKDARLDRRPWISGERETAAMRRMYHMRSELMPYIYSSVWQTHSTMVPLNRPMYIEYGGDERAYCNEQEFLFGDLLLAAPVSSPGTGPDKVASQRVWFPGEDVWYDFFTHERFDGGRECEISKPLEEFPLYVRGGWVLPMQPYTPRPASTPLTTLVMRVYPSAGDADNIYTLYEDDGVTRDYERGAYATTQLNYRRAGRVTTVTVRPAEGVYEGQVVKRAYRLQLPAAGKIEKVRVAGRTVKPVFDETLKCSVVEVPATDIRREVKIEIVG